MERSGSDFVTTTLVMLSVLGPSAFADTFVVYGASGNVGSLAKPSMTKKIAATINARGLLNS